MPEEKKMTDYVTREMYRQIKSMNREQMCNFLYNLYKEVYGDYEEKMKLDYKKIRSEVLKINGIGKVKADAIMEAIKRCMEGEHDEN